MVRPARAPQVVARLHALDRGLGHQPLTLEDAAPQVEAHVVGHLRRRGVDAARGPQRDVLVGEGGLAVGAVERGEQGPGLLALEIGRGPHAEPYKEALSDELLERHAAELLDDSGGDRRARVAVGEAGARPPARHPALGIEGQGVGERDTRLGERVLAQVDVVEARRVLEQVHHPHGVGRFPRVLEGNLWHQRAHGVLEAEAPFLHQRQHGEGHEALRGRADAEQGLGRGRPAGGDVGLAEAAGPHHPVAGDESDADAGGLGVGEHLADLALELGERLGDDLLLALSAGRKRSQHEEHQGKGCAELHAASFGHAGLSARPRIAAFQKALSHHS